MLRGWVYLNCQPTRPWHSRERDKRANCISLKTKKVKKKKKTRRRRRRREKQSLLSYAPILFCFFVLLSSTSPSQESTLQSPHFHRGPLNTKSYFPFSPKKWWPLMHVVPLSGFFRDHILAPDGVLS